MKRARRCSRRPVPVGIPGGVLYLALSLWAAQAWSQDAHSRVQQPQVEGHYQVAGPAARAYAEACASCHMLPQVLDAVRSHENLRERHGWLEAWLARHHAPDRKQRNLVIQFLSVALQGGHLGGSYPKPGPSAAPDNQLRGR